MFRIASALCVLETYFGSAKLSSPLIQTGIKLVYQAALLDFLNIIRSNGSNSSKESFCRGCDAQKDSTVSQFLFHHVRFLGQFISWRCNYAVWRTILTWLQKPALFLGLFPPDWTTFLFSQHCNVLLWSNTTNQTNSAVSPTFSPAELKSANMLHLMII